MPLLVLLLACGSDPTDSPVADTDPATSDSGVSGDTSPGDTSPGDTSPGDTSPDDTAPEPTCGDLTCDDDEDCETCPQDCGDCAPECGSFPLETDGPATLPTAEPDVRLHDSSGWTTLTVRSSGGDHTTAQEAYDAAVALGEAVRIQVEAGYDAGPLLMRDRGGATDWIYLEPESLAELPAGERATREDASAMYKLRGVLIGTTWTEAVGCEPGAGYTRLIGADISIPDDDTSRMRSHVVRIRGDANGEEADPTELEDTPTHVILDRVYVHLPVDGTRFTAYAIGLNGRDLAVIDSYVIVGGVGWEASKAINSGYAPGPLLIENNYLASDGINIFFGANETAYLGWTPSDITIRQNHVHKPLDWLGDRNTSVKNSFEIKDAQRVLVERNVFENNWVDAQAGTMILLRAEATDGVCRDVTFRFNRMTDTPAVWNILGMDGSSASESLRRVSIHDNLATRLGPNSTSGTAGHVVTLGSTPEAPIVELELAHNTFADTRRQSAFLSLSASRAGESVVFRDNVAYHGAYGVKADGTAEGTSSLDAAFGPGAWTWDFNVAADYPASSYPDLSNHYPSSSELAKELVDVEGGDYGLIEGSAYRAGGDQAPSDGEMRGADVACLDEVLAGVDDGVHGE